jgi:histidinol-phosphate aminotransferase
MVSLLEEIVPDYIHKLKPYQPGKPVEEVERELGISGAIKIASNENPMGPSPRAVEAARKALSDTHFYPDGGCFRLRQLLSERLKVSPDSLVFGAGCNEIIHMVILTFCRPGIDEVLTHKYAFISYRLAAVAYGAPFVESDVTAELKCDVDSLIGAITPNTRVIFLANPNNPTGAYLNRAEFERVLEAVPPKTILVVDEAYHEYATVMADDYPRSQDYHSKDRPLLITLRTFSKVYGLAGLRVGYSICDPEVANYLNRIRRPFNVTSIAQEAALAALEDQEHVNKSTDAARSGIRELTDAVEKIGLTAYPSLGNFVLVDVKTDPGPVHEKLQARGVIVRPMSAWGLTRHLRVSVGTPEQTRRVVEALAAVLS